MQRLAIIPARGGSKRIPRKNIAMLAGEPLIAHTLKTVLASNVFSRVIVSTEDQEIAEIAKTCKAEVYNRNPAYATDTAHELDACAEILEAIEADEGRKPEVFCVVYPTAVLLEPDDFRKSACLIEDNPAADVVMSVSTFNYHPYKALKKNEQGYLEMMFPVECKQRSQYYPDVRASNGTFYWLRTETFLENRDKSYYQDRLIAYDLPAGRAVDIDYPEDLKWVEFLLKAQKEKLI